MLSAYSAKKLSGLRVKTGFNAETVEKDAEF